MTSDAPPPLATYTYNGRNQIASHVVESGLFTATRTYDTAGRLIEAGTVSPSGPALDSTSYTLSPDGRRTGILRSGGIPAPTTETYGYDNARQVTAASYPDLATNQSWNYDAAGNRSTVTTNGATTSYTANSVNAYTAISGGGFQPPSPTYDANGNLLTGTVLPLGSSSLTSCVFTWNINNELISATNGSGDSASYQYDALGRRTQRTETLGTVTTTTWFLTNGWNVELEHNGSAWTTRQTWGLDLSGSLQGAGGVGGLVMVETLPSGGGSPVPSFPTYDGNGNITAWVNASGSVIARQRYDAYGNLIEQTGTPPSNYGFSTKPQEKVTGFHYYGYRFYDALTGRWPSRDPIGEGTIIDFNLYAFTANRSTYRVDFLGLRTEIDWEDYWKQYQKKYPDMTDQQKRWAEKMLALGCKGVTCLSLGDKPDNKNCYKTKEAAVKRQEELNKKSPACCAKVYSIHFWNDGKGGDSPEVTFSNNGKANMRDWDESSRPGGKWVRFDFGFLNSDGTITHADQYYNPDRNGDGKGDYFPDEKIRSKALIFVSTHEGWKKVIQISMKKFGVHSVFRTRQDQQNETSITISFINVLHNAVVCSAPDRKNFIRIYVSGGFWNTYQTRFCIEKN